MVFGGQKGCNRDGKRQLLNDVSMFDTVRNEWEEVKMQGLLVRGRWGHCAVVVSNYLISYGGLYEQGKALNELICFDILSGSWSALPVLRQNAPPPLFYATMEAVFY